MRFEIIKQLSRSDKVYLAVTDEGEKVVLKKYHDRVAQNLESTMLNQLSVSGYAPKILEYGDHSIIYEYIEGVSLEEKFVSYTMADDVDGLIRLANELSVFLQIFNAIADGYTINDINFTNFIIKDGRCYGVDYDSVSTGMQYMDIAKVVAYAVTHAVGNVLASYPFIKQLLKNFRLEMLDIINDVRDALEQKLDRDTVDYILNSLMNIESWSRNSV